MTRVSFRGGGGGHLPPLEFVCQYAHYDNPICRPLKVFQIHISPPSTNFLNETLHDRYYTHCVNNMFIEILYTLCQQDIVSTRHLLNIIHIVSTRRLLNIIHIVSTRRLLNIIHIVSTRRLLTT